MSSSGPGPAGSWAAIAAFLRENPVSVGATELTSAVLPGSRQRQKNRPPEERHARADAGLAAPVPSHHRPRRALSRGASDRVALDRGADAHDHLRGAAP